MQGSISRQAFKSHTFRARRLGHTAVSGMKPSRARLSGHAVSATTILCTPHRAHLRTSHQYDRHTTSKRTLLLPPLIVSVEIRPGHGGTRQSCAHARWHGPGACASHARESSSTLVVFIWPHMPYFWPCTVRVFQRYVACLRLNAQN